MANDPASGARERNLRVFEGPFGAVYGFYMGRRWLNAVIAKLAWNSDIRPFFESMQAIAAIADRGTIVDAPCGTGVAFPALPPDKEVRYLAFDLSPAMLKRARRRARALGLRQIQLAEADAESLPVEDATADLFLSYFGLHCFAGPEMAVAEVARCLRSGGTLVGSMITRGKTQRHKVLVRPGRGGFGPGGTADDLREWLSEAGFLDAAVDESGLFAYFRARKP